MTKQFHRFEFKYALSPGIGPNIREEIKKFGMKPDAYATEIDGSYFVTSLYFDSFDLLDYQEKTGGFMERKKLRARIYERFLDKSPNVTLEIKHRHESKNAKTKIQLTRSQWDKFTEKGPSALFEFGLSGKKREKEEILRNFIHFSAKPRIKIRYLRKAFMNESENLRINFDSNLEACRSKDFKYNDFMIPVHLGGEIMEVKYAYILPAWLGDIIKKYNLSKDAFSKYSNALEAVHRHNPILR